MTYDTSRIRRMRQRMLARPAVCVERCAILTRSFQATEGESAPIRRARAFADLLDQMTIRIEPDELVVGRPTSKVRGGSISPELQCGWILDELDLLSTRDTDPFLPLTDPGEGHPAPGGALLAHPLGAGQVGATGPPGQPPL